MMRFPSILLAIILSASCATTPGQPLACDDRQGLMDLMNDYLAALVAPVTRDSSLANLRQPRPGLVSEIPANRRLSHFRHSFSQKQTPIYGVEGVASRDVSMFNPFDMPAMHIFKSGPEGQIHDIETVGIVVPYQSSTGWGW